MSQNTTSSPQSSNNTADSPENAADDPHHRSGCSSSLDSSILSTCSTARAENTDAQVVDGTLDFSHAGFTHISRRFRRDYETVVTLDISHNQFGSFPQADMFKRCIRINASHNYFRKLGTLSPISRNLTEICLAHNKISEIGCELRTFVSLRTLDLSYNEIKHIPSLSDLKKLVRLDLSHNLLIEAPCIASCADLVDINLADNFISTVNVLLAHVAQIPSITRLDVSGNEISDLSEFLHLFHHPSIKEISLANNPCLKTALDPPCFNYRSYIYACCPSALETVDGDKLDMDEVMQGEWLYAQGRVRSYRPGQHDQLCDYLFKRVPLKATGRISQGVDASCKMALQKRMELEQSLHDEVPRSDDDLRTAASVSSPSLYSPYSEWSRQALAPAENKENREIEQLHRDLELARIRRPRTCESQNSSLLTTPPDQHFMKARQETRNLTKNSPKSTTNPNSRRCVSPGPGNKTKLFMNTRIPVLSSTPVKSLASSMDRRHPERSTEGAERKIFSQLSASTSTIVLSTARDFQEERGRVDEDDGREERSASCVVADTSLPFLTPVHRPNSSAEHEEMMQRFAAMEADVVELRRQNETLTATCEELYALLVRCCEVRQPLPAPEPVTAEIRGPGEAVIRWVLPTVQGFKIIVNDVEAGTVRGLNNSAKLTSFAVDEESAVQVQAIGLDGRLGPISKKLHIPPYETSPTQQNEG